MAYSREPIAAANAARALSELYPDRFILGLGVSNAAANERRGVRYERPVEFMKSDLARMKAAPYMAPPPAAEAPVVLGSFLPQMVRLAAEATAGVLTYFTPPEKTAQVWRTALAWRGVEALGAARGLSPPGTAARRPRTPSSPGRAPAPSSRPSRRPEPTSVLTFTREQVARCLVAEREAIIAELERAKADYLAPIGRSLKLTMRPLGDVDPERGRGTAPAKPSR